MIYLLHILMAIVGLYMIGAASVAIVDEYRATRPSVTQLSFGEDTTPTFFVNGTLVAERNNGAPAISMDWTGKEIKFKPLLGEGKP